MAVHDDSNGQKQKSSDAVDEIPTFNAENMQNNTRIINYSRTFMSIIGGVVAGISGYDGLMGFVFYFIAMAITTAGLAAKTGFDVHSYFDSWNRIVFDGILGGLLSFVLFWTLIHPSFQFLDIDKDLPMTSFIYSEGNSIVLTGILVEAPDNGTLCVH